jgi:bacteriocin biosynthesis cyclodehydratase domain-containing protein
MSRVVRDPERRRILGPLMRLAAASPVTVAGVAERLGVPPGDVEAIARQLLEDELLVVIDAEREATPVTVAGKGELADGIVALLTSDMGDHVAKEELDVDGGDIGAARDGVVVLALDARRPALEHEFNVWAAEAGQSFMRVALDGDEALIGPLVVPGKTACLNCFDMQDEATRQFPYDYVAYKDALDSGAAPRSSATTCAVAASFAARAVIALDSGGWGFLAERVIRVNFDTLEVTTDRILQFPRCPVCVRTRHEPRHTFL